MRRLSVISAITVLLVAAASLSDAAKTVKGSKSNSDNRIEGAATPAVPGKDPCTDYKNDTNRYGACQKAARLGGSQARQVSVCSGGYWWLVSWGGITQDGPCREEGAIKH